MCRQQMKTNEWNYYDKGGQVNENNLVQLVLLIRRLER